MTYPLRIDVEVIDKKTRNVLCWIEFDGEQHFVVVAWGSEDVYKRQKKFVGGYQRDRVKDLHAAVKGFPLLRVRNTIVTNENEEKFLMEIMSFVDAQVTARNDPSFAPEKTSRGVKYLDLDEHSTFKISKRSEAYETATCLYKTLRRACQATLDFFWKYE